jgi:hypothetical protein
VVAAVQFVPSLVLKEKISLIVAPVPAVVVIPVLLVIPVFLQIMTEM